MSNLATLQRADDRPYQYGPGPRRGRRHDRLLKTRFPVATRSADSSSATDYEQLGYDANSNVTSRRLRDGNSIAFTFDKLNRATAKDLPGGEPDVAYAYDNLNRLTSAAQTGNSLTFTYDALSRNLTQVGPQGTVTSDWDAAGRRTRLTDAGIDTRALAL